MIPSSSPSTLSVSTGPSSTGKRVLIADVALASIVLLVIAIFRFTFRRRKSSSPGSDDYIFPRHATVVEYSHILANNALWRAEWGEAAICAHAGKYAYSEPKIRRDVNVLRPSNAGYWDRWGQPLG
ncbi:hypothetical protein ARMGADRAFT_298445 [Armillaria gallica]|uniref:Uncharacterized protein n=1 Tax=Armillaria gallica TaxID=47427 RepID=A0A2H3D8J9_ARMGA|nr:hypothetical protein ARMGADRAFT_298445 [Armillaria gallica]